MGDNIITSKGVGLSLEVQTMKAVQTLAPKEQRNPNDPNLFMGKGIAEFELCNFKEALNNFKSAKKRSVSFLLNSELLEMYITMSESYVEGELISINEFLSKFEK